MRISDWSSDVCSSDLEIARAHRAGLKTVVTPLSLPGLRWIQNNDGRYDGRLWRDKRYWREAAAFWRDLAAAPQDTPGIAAYNLINYPTPEKGAGLPEHSDAATQRAWYGTDRKSTRLNYRHLIAYCKPSCADKQK